MDRLTEAELAERAGATAEQIRELCAAGIVSPAEDGAFGPADAVRVRLAEAFGRAGISLEQIGTAIRSGHLSFSFVDLLFPEPVAFTGITYREACEMHRYPPDLVRRIHETVGLPSPAMEDQVREDDMAMFEIGRFVLDLGMDEAFLTRALRVYGENVRRIAAAEPVFYHTMVEEPFARSGMSEAQMRELASQISPQVRTQAEHLILWLYRRHQEHYTIEHLVEHVEDALEEAGLAPPRPVRPPAICFLDLTGYTALTEQQGDEAAADLAAALGELVTTNSRRLGGMPVKWLGDGVMFHFPDPSGAVACMVDMVEAVPTAGLPPAHVGVHAGPVVFRDGDYFGRTVNVASRIAGYAGPGQVLVSEDAAAACSIEGVRFEPLGPVSLKGVSRPVVLHRAARA